MGPLGGILKMSPKASVGAFFFSLSFKKCFQGKLNMCRTSTYVQSSVSSRQLLSVYLSVCDSVYVAVCLSLSDSELTEFLSKE